MSETNEIHVTRIDTNGGVYGHSTDCCDESGCSGEERYYGQVDGAEVGAIVEVE